MYFQNNEFLITDMSFKILTNSKNYLKAALITFDPALPQVEIR